MRKVEELEILEVVNIVDRNAALEKTFAASESLYIFIYLSYDSETPLLGIYLRK